MVLIAIQVHNLSLVDIEQFLILLPETPNFDSMGEKFFVLHL
jgi:hypothetical protein